MNLRAYAELARLSNTPTVVTNVMVGAAAAAAVTGGSLSWPRTAVTAVACVLLYVAGMALNDVLDREIDARERPHRPIPSSRVTLAGAHAFVVACIVIALGALLMLSPAALFAGLALVAAIVAYDLVHARTPWSVLLMGACRALVPVAAALAALAPFGSESLWRRLAPACGALALHVVLLSVVARREVTGGGRGVGPLALALPWIALAPLLAAWWAGWYAPAAMWHVLLCLVLFVAWMYRSAAHLRQAPPRIPRAIGGWIAGMALLDATSLALLGQPVAAMVAIACLAATALWQRSIAGT